MSTQRPGPKEGVYLDAALAVIGEQIAERIDEVERRRRIGARLGAAVLAVSVIASGSVAAVALATRDAEEVPTPIAYAEPATVRCLETSDVGDPAYFTVRYRTSAEFGIDSIRLCRTAWQTILAEGESLRAKSPTELADAAADLIAGAADATETPVVAVDEAAFGRVKGAQVLSMAVCSEGRETVVLGGIEALSATERAQACARAIR